MAGVTTERKKRRQPLAIRPPTPLFGRADHRSHTLASERIVIVMDVGRSLLTATEARVLELLSQGLTEREMAEKLCVSMTTVHTHVKSIFKKLRVRNKVSAAVWYVKHEHVLDKTLRPVGYVSHAS